MSNQPDTASDAHDRRSSSPPKDRSSESVASNPANPANPANPTNPAHVHSTTLLAVARKVDAGATISAVTKAHESTLVKIDPSPDAGTTTTLATLAALRVAFPFATVTAVESFSSGSTQFQILLHTDTQELRHAKAMCRDRRSMKTLKALSNAFAVAGLCTYGALLYATVIRPDAVV
jgi:hypothetical protein